jgi:low temperature requirement protein LtrA
MARTAQPALLRERGADQRQRVTTTELFFDLVFVFAVTQLSDFLLGHRTLAGALQAALLLVMVWLLWAYTTWVTNWFDPEKIPMRLLLLALMLVSLAMSAALPNAFRSGGLLVGGAYAVMQIGRTLFAVLALRRQPPDSPYRPLARNFERILSWCCVSGALAVSGGLVHAPWLRALLWLAAAGVDELGGAVGFYTPGLGSSTTQEWNIEGGHFAERCQGFILIAFGESIVVTGATLAGLLDGPLARPGAQHAPTVAAFLVAFVGSAALWWLYFDRSAADAAAVIASSRDPGRIGRSAYHYIHPVMVGGIILVAAADDALLAAPGAVGVASTSWLILGGPALYLLGLLAFKLVIWRRLAVSRVAALVVLGLLGLAAVHVTALVLASCVTATLVAAALADSVHSRQPAQAED